MAIQTGAATLSNSSTLAAAAIINPTAKLSSLSALSAQATQGVFGGAALATASAVNPPASGGSSSSSAFLAAPSLTTASGEITGIDNTSSTETTGTGGQTIYEVMWFTFDLPSDIGSWQISTTTSPTAWDSKLMLLKATDSPPTEAGLSQIAYNDDEPSGNTYMSTMSGTSLTAGTYYIAYGSYSPSSGVANGALSWSGLTGLTAPAPTIATVRGVWEFTSSTGETWRFPRNPREMTNPMPSRKLVSGGRSPINDWFPVVASPRSAQEWSFSGSVKTQDHYNTLISWLNRTEFVYVTDHFQRTWKVRFTKFTLDELRPNSRSDWRFKYQVTCLVYGRTA